MTGFERASEVTRVKADAGQDERSMKAFGRRGPILLGRVKDEAMRTLV